MTVTPSDEEIHHAVKLLHDPIRNKGTAFTEGERDAFGLRGLLPPRVQSQSQQVLRVLGNLRDKSSDLERYVFLIGLQDRNETLFYRVLTDHIEEIMPLVYTPTVGRACQEYGHLFRRPRGLYISLEDRGRVAEILGNWPHRDARVIVVTDGERILGLGDLGADGMGIPIGKLSLYTACAGIAPTHCLPVMLDVGTDNEALLKDPLYLGIDRPRERGPAYDDLVEEFVSAAVEAFPGVLIQLEDFATLNAFRLLERYRDRICTFDDDIQGTASVALAGFYSALRISGGRLKDQRFLFLGMGEAGCGIGSLVVAALKDEGLDDGEALARCWFVDSRGLVTTDRRDLPAHKRPFAREHPPIRDFAAAVDALRPTVIVGVSGQPGAFTREIVESMARENDRPVIFALSNPTSKSECTAEQAYTWSNGRAIFASGSPFEPVHLAGQTFVPGQGNNAYIFPGVGLGVVVSGARHVSDEMFFEAAKTLAGEVSEEDLALGRIYPALGRIRDVSASIAEAVADVAFRRGLATATRPDDLGTEIRSHMYQPVYSHLA